jgi:hypothetical protein
MSRDNSRAVLELSYRLYNERRFAEMKDLFADEITAFSPGMRGSEPKNPALFSRDAFVTLLAQSRETAGTVRILDLVAQPHLVVATVEFETGLTASHTVQFLPNLTFCKSFMVRWERLKEAKDLGAMAWTAEPRPTLPGTAAG